MGGGVGFKNRNPESILAIINVPFFGKKQVNNFKIYNVETSNNHFL